MYDYIYYQMYKWNLAFKKDSEQPSLNAMLVVGFLAFVNLINLSLLAEAIVQVSILDFNNYSIWYWIATLLGILILHYFLFIYKSRYKRIISYFDNLNDRDVNKRKWVLAYVCLSFLLLIGLIIYNILVAE